MVTNIQIETDLLFATSRGINAGWTWTLASRLGHILTVAQQLYGPRDSKYTILGVEIGGDTPQIWYPGNCGHVIVQISKACATDMSRACFQMAHEAIHLLSPSGSASTIVLDEGLASHFSARYTREHLNALWHDDVASYIKARVQTEKLLAIDTDIIRKIRLRQPSLPRVTLEDIQAVQPRVPDELALALTQTFVR